ncbi:MAG: condensation domain-containing protein [Psychrosphaera sp.]|nr:condensation domain-containing protein [Psychrosphaera sp.]
MISIKALLQYFKQHNIAITVSGGKLKTAAAPGLITQEVGAFIKANKQRLIDFLEAVDTNKQRANLIVPRPPAQNEAQNQPLASFAQQRLWFIDKLGAGSAEYNMPVALRVEGHFDRSAAAQAITRIIQRHQPLRTVFAEQHEQVVQVIGAVVAFDLKHHDLSGLTAQEQAVRIKQHSSDDAQQSFDLTADLMVRAAYLSLGVLGERQQGILLFNMHHIASDGWSMGILVNEFVSQYQALIEGKPDPLPPLEIHYADYAHWQRQWITGAVLKNQLNYWTEQLADIPASHGLDLDHARPQMKQYRGEMVLNPLSLELSQQLLSLAQTLRVTPFMLLHGAIGLVLSRHSHSADIVLGTPVANRPQKALEPLIGFFVNTLVLRTNTDHPTFIDYIEHVKAVNLAAQANQDVPFAQLVEHLKVARSLQLTPLFQIMFSMDNNASGELTLPDVTFSSMAGDDVVAKFDLDISAWVEDQRIHFSWEYDTAIFNRQRIETLNLHLQGLLESIAAKPQATLADLSMLPAQETERLSVTLNAPQVELQNSDLQNPTLQNSHLLHQLFEHQVAQQPHKIALIFAGEQVSYQQLNQQANQLAHFLRAQGVKADSLVGLCANRSIEMIVAMLAILKAGGAYVPLDPDYPPARLHYMLADTGVNCLLTQAGLTDNLELADNVNLIVLGTEQHQQVMGQYPGHNLDLCAGQSPSNLAYVIYTSGTTGQPKGVMVEQRNVTNLITSQTQAFGFSAD